jgi:RHS repeat-associated protein
MIKNQKTNLDRLTTRTIQTWTWVIWITSESYNYDQLWRLIEANDTNNHKLNFTYDSLNRLLQENQSGSLVSYDYDDNNNLLSITNPNNKITSYTYDELDRVTNISQSWTTIATYSYTWVLNDKITYGNWKEISQTFDSLNRLNSLNNWVKNYTYTYDDVSNITSDNEKNYTYDDIYRVTQVNNTQSGTLLERFNYDNAGNRTNDLNNSYTNNNLNQYTSVIASGATQSTLTYDNNWNLINDWTKTYEYDYKNRLVKVTSWSWIIAEFKYDVLGRRYEKLVRHSELDSESLKYVYSNQNLLEEIRNDWIRDYKKEYINWLWIDNILAVEQEEPNLTIQEREELSFCNTSVLNKSTEFIKYWWQLIVDRCNSLSASWSVIVENRYYLHKNHLWSTVAITDNSGSLVSEYEYDVFGKSTLVSWDDIWNTILYTWREYDKEINLYYYRARYYDADLWRFISRDPIWQVDDVNLYGYVGGNSVMYVDPSGLGKTLFLLWEEKEWLLSIINWNLIHSIYDYEKKWLNKNDILFYEWVKTTEQINKYISENLWSIKEIIFITHANNGLLWLNWDIDKSNIKWIKNINRFWDSKIKFTLIWCNSGKWTDSIAQNLSNELWINVTAPTWYIAPIPIQWEPILSRPIDVIGTIVDNSSIYGLDINWVISDFNLGKWNEFSPEFRVWTSYKWD